MRKILFAVCLLILSSLTFADKPKQPITLYSIKTLTPSYKFITPNRNIGKNFDILYFYIPVRSILNKINISSPNFKCHTCEIYNAGGKVTDSIIINFSKLTGTTDFSPPLVAVVIESNTSLVPYSHTTYVLDQPVIEAHSVIAVKTPLYPASTRFSTCYGVDDRNGLPEFQISLELKPL